MEKTAGNTAPSLKEDLNIKKRKSMLGDWPGPVDSTRRALLTAGEFHRGLAEASAEAIRAFDDELKLEHVQASGLTSKVIDGIAESNVRFFEVMAKASRRLVEQLRAEAIDKTDAVSSEIDYERLAKLVAVELKKNSPSI